MEKGDILQRWDQWNYFEVWSKDYQQILFYWQKWDKTKCTLCSRYINQYRDEAEDQEVIDKYEQFWTANIDDSRR